MNHNISSLTYISDCTQYYAGFKMRQQIYHMLLLIREVCNLKPTHEKSWVWNLLMWSDLNLHPSFKVKRGESTLKMLITSRIFSLYIFYYCFYRFAMFGDTPPARNKVSGLSLVFVYMQKMIQTFTKMQKKKLLPHMSGSPHIQKSWRSTYYFQSKFNQQAEVIKNVK